MGICLVSLCFILYNASSYVKYEELWLMFYLWNAFWSTQKYRSKSLHSSYIFGYQKNIYNFEIHAYISFKNLKVYYQNDPIYQFSEYVILAVYGK